VFVRRQSVSIVYATKQPDSKGGKKIDATYDCGSFTRNSCRGNVSEETRQEEADLLQELNICDVLYWVLCGSDDQIMEM